MGPENHTAGVCRLCDKATGKLKSIFDKNEDGSQIVNIIKDVLPIIIYRTDPLSKHVCEKCGETLDIISKFKYTAVQVHQKYLEELEQQKVDPKVQLYLEQQATNQNSQEEKCNGTLNNFIPNNSIIKMDASTSTDTLTDTKSEDELNSTELMEVLTSNGINDFDSDMDIESDVKKEETVFESRKRKIRENDYELPIIKRPKLTESVTKLPPPEEKFKIVKYVYYMPHSLLKLAINTINKQNVPEFDEPHFDRIEEDIEEEIYFCAYCGITFETGIELAVHESNEHMQLCLEKVDSLELWDDEEEDIKVRNKWLRETFLQDSEEEEEEEFGDELLMPMEEASGVVDTTRNKDIVFINEQPTLHGVCLRDLPKDKRNDFYQSVRLNGIRRKFCNLCRYTFKDHWAIELHYMSRTCYYTCNYCGIKFNKNKHSFSHHIQDHINRGDRKSDKVFVNNSNKSVIAPKELSESCMKPYKPVIRNYSNNVNTNVMHMIPSVAAPKFKQQIQPIKMKSLLEKKRVNPMTFQVKSEMNNDPNFNYNATPVTKQMTTADLTDDTQAYFCKMCYQVFCKRDEYNEHMNRCKGEVDDPEMNLIRPYRRSDPSQSSATKRSPMVKSSQMDEMKVISTIKGYSSAGRPIRHCVKEVSYTDEREVEYRAVKVTQGRYECNFCCSVFPTVHSRNSHMRIHKSNFKHSPAGKPAYVEPASKFIPQKKIKQEVFEPIVDIHEGPSKKPATNLSDIGSVSITPIRKNNQTGTLSPAIMKLVQNNPNITLKAKAPAQPLLQPKIERESPPPSNYDDSSQTDSGERMYKCSSCNKPFSNKSNLYFHKKNQCGGSKYPCPFCKKRFGTEASYSSHIFYEHPE